MADHVRAFFALPLPDELQPAVTALQGALYTRAPDLRFTDTHQLHVTMKFLGWIGAEAVPALVRTLDEIAAATAAISTVARGLDGFPSLRRARVLVLRLEDPIGQFAALARELEVLGESVGVAREERPFNAHLTLARAKPPADLRALVAAGRWSPTATSFDSIRLYQSTLRREGSEYSVLHEAKLGG